MTDTREPLASVSKIVKKGNWVVLGSDRSYIENVLTGKRIELTEQKGTYHLDVDVLTPSFAGPACRMRADACRGRSPRRGCPRMPRPRSTTSHGAFTASVDEESKQGHRRQEARSENATPEVHMDYCFMRRNSDDVQPYWSPGTGTRG